MFIERVEAGDLPAALAAGRAVYEWKTKDPHQLPILGPSYDDHPGRNRAKRENRYAETLDAAREVAARMHTEIVAALFLTGA
ncbi:MAG: hypothetical protein ACRD2E_09490 [Terriglobales bacterium]